MKAFALPSVDTAWRILNLCTVRSPHYSLDWRINVSSAGPTLQKTNKSLTLLKIELQTHISPVHWVVTVVSYPASSKIKRMQVHLLKKEDGQPLVTSRISSPTWMPPVRDAAPFGFRPHTNTAIRLRSLCPARLSPRPCLPRSSCTVNTESPSDPYFFFTLSATWSERAAIRWENTNTVLAEFEHPMFYTEYINQLCLCFLCDYTSPSLAAQQTHTNLNVKSRRHPTEREKESRTYTMPLLSLSLGKESAQR